MDIVNKAKVLSQAYSTKQIRREAQNQNGQRFFQIAYVFERGEEPNLEIFQSFDRRSSRKSYFPFHEMFCKCLECFFEPGVVNRLKLINSEERRFARSQHFERDHAYGGSPETC
jgi:hypothetical protein